MNGSSLSQKSSGTQWLRIPQMYRLIENSLIVEPKIEKYLR